ncbi:MAG: hypothetical protein ACREM3_30525 [Candidatus Rokuibacteriota bacterium]
MSQRERIVAALARYLLHLELRELEARLDRDAFDRELSKRIDALHVAIVT